MWIELALFPFLAVCAVYDGLCRKIPLIVVWMGMLTAVSLHLCGVMGETGLFAVATSLIPGASFSAQLLYRREGGIWGRLDAYDDRTVSGRLPMLSDPVCGTFGGICGGRCFVCPEKNRAGQRNSFSAISAFGSGGGSVFIRKTAKGYMTLEASFLITWTLFLFVLIIYLSFYSYDKCVLFQDAYTVCFGEHTEERGQGCALHRCAHAEAIREKIFRRGKSDGDGG